MDIIRTITDIAGLDAAEPGTVVRDRDDFLLVKVGENDWLLIEGDNDIFGSLSSEEIDGAYTMDNKSNFYPLRVIREG